MYLEIFLADFAFLGEFRGISRKCLNFAGPRPREISEALSDTCSNISVADFHVFYHTPCKDFLTNKANFGGLYKCKTLYQLMS